MTEHHLNTLKELLSSSKKVENSAELDAEILAKVYLAMTAGQTVLDLAAISQEDPASAANVALAANQQPAREYNLKIIYANEQEQADNAAMLAMINKQKK